MTMLMLSGGLSVALIAGGCGNNANNSAGTTGTAGTSADQNAPVTLTGCLQKSSGMNNFVLTQVSTPAGAVGTSGSAANPDRVAQEQRVAAERSYRLDGDNDELNNLVGKQVKVSGRVTDRGDLKDKTRDERGTTGTLGAPKNNPDDIDAGDLAKVDVDAITKVADACGASNPGPR
jgi:hypothetical protein